MRTLGFRTHVLLSLAAAAGLVLTLSRPWYAAAPRPVPEHTRDIGDINGPLNGLFEGIQRWLTSPEGASGWESLSHWGIGLAAMAGIAALGAMSALVPQLQALGRDLLRYGALAAFGIAAWKLFDPPGANASLELRYGALAGAGFAIMLLTSAMGVASAPMRRKAAPRTYQAAPAPQPPAYGTSGSSAPPGG